MKPDGRKPCVFPSPTELDLGVIPGLEPGTAVRVRVEPGRDGYVRLEQLAHSDDLGWYTQKSFCLPAAMVQPLIRQLRKADCYLPRDADRDAAGPLPFCDLIGQLRDDRDDEEIRRDA